MKSKLLASTLGLALLALPACASISPASATLDAPRIEMTIHQMPCYIGEPVTIGVVAQGEALTYQWMDAAGRLIEGATEPMYSFIPLSVDESGDFTCAISNSGGTAVATIAVKITLPKVWGAPGAAWVRPAPRIGAATTAAAAAPKPGPRALPQP